MLDIIDVAARIVFSAILSGTLLFLRLHIPAAVIILSPAFDRQLNHIILHLLLVSVRQIAILI